MKLPEEFMRALPSKTPNELYEILDHNDDYLPEAIAAAKDEILRRGLPIKNPEQKMGKPSKSEVPRGRWLIGKVGTFVAVLIASATIKDYLLKSLNGRSPRSGTTSPPSQAQRSVEWQTMIYAGVYLKVPSSVSITKSKETFHSPSLQALVSESETYDGKGDSIAINITRMILKPGTDFDLDGAANQGLETIANKMDNGLSNAKSTREIARRMISGMDARIGFCAGRVNGTPIRTTTITINQGNQVWLIFAAANSEATISMVNKMLESVQIVK